MRPRKSLQIPCRSGREQDGAGNIAVSGSDLLMVPTLGPMVKGYFPGNIPTDHGSFLSGTPCISCDDHDLS